MDAERIWADAYAAGRPGWTVERVQALLDELVRVKLIFRWEAEGKLWGYWIGDDKPGHLPPPSQRYSESPAPPKQELSAFLGLPYGDPAAAQGIAHTGFGIGFGPGTGRGTATAASQTVAGPSPNGEKDQNLGETPNSQAHPSEFGVSGNTTLTTVAVLQHLSCLTGEEFRVGDPVVALLASLADEYLEATKGVPLCGFKEGVGTDGFYEIPPGHPEYPKSLDDAGVEGGLTLRESAVCRVYSAFTFCCDIFCGLRQYIPIEEVPGEELQYMMRSLGFVKDTPMTDFPAVTEIWAAAHWAFNKSDYWPKKLKNVKNFVDSLTTILEQYAKYYDKVPDGKKPHDLKVGWPKERAATA